MIDKKSVDKIGVIMFGLFGDVLMRTAVLKALQEIFPDAKIYAICDANMKTILQNNPYIEGIISFDREKKNFLLKNYNKIKGIVSVRKQKFKLLVDLYNGGSSPLITLLSGAKYRVGYAHQKDAKVYNILSDYIPYQADHLDSFNYQLLSILRPLSDARFSLEPIYKISKAVESDIERYMQSFEYSLDKLYTLNLGSNGKEKLLENEKYFELILYLYKRYNYIPAIVRNPSQEHFQEELINNFLKPNNIPYVKLKALSIEGVAVIIKYTQFIVTPDTGLMHLALALDSYIAAIFTYTNPALVDISKEKFVAIYEEFPKAVLYKKQEITVSILKEKIDTLMEQIANEK